MAEHKFLYDTLRAAKELLNYVLVHQLPDGSVVAGRIVETEAYLYDDPASHTFRGQTGRNTPMFMTAGTMYVYFTYGMHHCFNIVTSKEGHGEAVLIRALEPVAGVEEMLMRRNLSEDKIKNLANGPAKLVQALGLTKHHHNAQMLGKNVFLLELFDEQEKNIVQTTRIGIKEGAGLPYRFYVRGNVFVSKK